MEFDTKNLYECVVIGGGVPGSTAAYHLAKLGRKVALLEKTQGPHHKVCGEFLSFESIEYLNEMGISLSEEAPLIKNFRLFSPRSDDFYARHLFVAAGKDEFLFRY